MRNFLVFQALSTLTGREFVEFEEFVRSPFFNKSGVEEALLHYFKDCIRENRLPEKEAAFQAVFPGRPYKDERLRFANTSLLALLDHYLSYRETMAEPEANGLRLVSAYRKRRLQKHFSAALRDTEKRLERYLFRHADYYDYRYQAAWEQYQFDTSERRSGSLNLQELSDYLDVAFSIRKLRLACLVISHQTFEKAEYEIRSVASALECADLHGEDIPVLLLYACCFRFLTQPDNAKEFFYQATTLLNQNAALLPSDELRPLYLLAINFGIKQMNDGYPEWPRATLDLYQQALQRELLLENGQLSRFAFNNIAAIALRLNELDWAEQFVEQYRPFLEREWRELTASLNRARIAYARNQPREALLHLQRADYKDPLNNLIAKTLQLKIYYETSEYDSLESHLHSMQTFIRRHTRIGYHRTNYMRIVQYTGKLLRLNFNNAEAVKALRREIESETGLSERAWLLEQLT